MNYGTVTPDGNSGLLLLQRPVSEEEANEQAHSATHEKLRRWSLATGICYVVIIVCGIVAEVGIRGNLIDYSSPQTTAEQIRANPSGLRWSVLLEMIMATADVLVAILFGLILGTFEGERMRQK